MQESVGYKVKAELRNGEIYHGTVTSAEESMSVHLFNVTKTARDGQKSQLEYCCIRGNQIKFVILPELLANASLFKRYEKKAPESTYLGSKR